MNDIIDKDALDPFIPGKKDYVYYGVPYTHKLAPLEHQHNELHKTLRKTAWALFMEMGTGKSKIIIDTLALHAMRSNIYCAFVTAKAGEYRNWSRKEIPTHWPDGVQAMVYEYTAAMSASAIKRMSDAIADCIAKGTFCFVVINVEAFGKRKKTYTKGAMFVRQIISVLARHGKHYAMIVDESTCVKNHKASRSIVVKEIADGARLRRIMSGSPITEAPIDIWGQSVMLGRGILGVTSYTAFKAEFCIEEKVYMGTHAYNDIIGYKNQGELERRYNSFSTVMALKDCVDLPPQIYRTTFIDMTDEQDKLYRQLSEEAIAELENGETIEATNVLSLMNKLHQVVVGHLKLPDRIERIKTNRPKVLLERLEETRGKVLIFSSFRQGIVDAYEAIAKQYGPESVEHYYGDTPASVRPEIIEAFQDPNSPVKYLVANQQSAGYGLTLTEAKTTIYYCNGYSGEQRIQSEARTHRIGQDQSVLYDDFIALGTVDQTKYQMLRNKKDLASDVINGRMSLRDVFFPREL